VVLCEPLVRSGPKSTVLNRIELHSTKESWQNATSSDRRCWNQVTTHDADGVIFCPFILTFSL